MYIYTIYISLRAYRGPLFLDRPAGWPRITVRPGRPAGQEPQLSRQGGRLINDRVGRPAGYYYYYYYYYYHYYYHYH